MRRPVAARNAPAARRAAGWLATRGVTPNRISQASVAFAALGGALFWLAGEGAPGALALILAALCVQARLACNLFDGMVAVEGARGAPDGPFWNEAPDRLSDLLLLAGAGAAAGAPALGWAAGALAVATAYLRELGRAEGLAPDFSGPMAKPQRMAALTFAALLAAVWRDALLWGLVLIALGTALTAWRRSARLVRGLRA
ncbi:CDP-alcohol phosphatidyltransferase family protein [Hasllibacter halocynthiae]|uniref:CDP-alcohol phosphatidyltransferase family protein n=1 Tax=Hasllibacter halocynthiae TaxID=595589 RepID=UPI003CCBFCD4